MCSNDVGAKVDNYFATLWGDLPRPFILSFHVLLVLTYHAATMGRVTNLAIRSRASILAAGKHSFLVTCIVTRWRFMWTTSFLHSWHFLEK